MIALQKYSRLAFASLLTMVFLLSAMFIPVPGDPYFTFLDRPLVEMLMFVPLALLGGLGCAGLIGHLHNQSKMLQAFGVALVALAIGVHALFAYSFYPSDCCSLVKSDDLVALNWLDRNLPSSSNILISSGEMLLTTSLPAVQNAGSDAGVWITPLTGRPTFSLPYYVDFGSPATLAAICQHSANEIYIGGTGQSFNATSLDQKPAWYRLILFLPRARVYQVLGCMR